MGGGPKNVVGRTILLLGEGTPPHTVVAFGEGLGGGVPLPAVIPIHRIAAAAEWGIPHIRTSTCLGNS